MHDLIYVAAGLGDLWGLAQNIRGWIIGVFAAVAIVLGAGLFVKGAFGIVSNIFSHDNQRQPKWAWKIGSVLVGVALMGTSANSLGLFASFTKGSHNTINEIVDGSNKEVTNGKQAANEIAGGSAIFATTGADGTVTFHV